MVNKFNNKNVLIEDIIKNYKSNKKLLVKSLLKIYSIKKENSHFVKDVNEKYF